MAISAALIQEALDNIQKTSRPYLRAQPFQNFAPMRFEEDYTKRLDPTAPTYLMRSIGEQSRLATAQTMSEARNQRQFEYMQDERKKAERLQKIYNRVRGNEPAATPAPNQPQRNRQPQASQRRWGADRLPEVSDIGKLRPNAPQVTMSLHGRDYTVNRQVAPIFQAFLRDLWQRGYKPASIQGYNPRNIAGTNTPSLHSYGFAIDIDPNRNPEGSGRGALPPRVGALAAKYGLAWGGNWTSRSTDPMHFSVPFRGRE